VRPSFWLKFGKNKGNVYKDIISFIRISRNALNRPGVTAKTVETRYETWQAMYVHLICV